ncbi:hypothetical protein ACB092_M015200 [Castanea dentata]
MMRVREGLEMLFRTMWKPNSGNDVRFSSLMRRYISASGRSVLDMAAKDGELRVFIVSGEVSGDSIGSRLMVSLKKLCPLPIRFSGVGGSMMSRQGLISLFPMEDIAVMGIWELLPHLNKFRLRLKETMEAAFLFQPHVVVTVDSKGFSFRLLKQLRANYSQQGLDGPVHFHYVAPSFWAWKGGEARLKGLAEFVDQGKDTSPYEWKVERNFEDFRSKNGIPAEATVISLLPGSRLQEVTQMLSIFSNTMELLKDFFPELMSVIHVAPNQHVENYITGIVHKWPVPAILIPGGLPHLKYDAFSASRVALCTSGTVALEMQLARLPCVVAYRAHLLTEWFIRYKAKISYISLPNILLDSAIIPEALFQACTPSKLASLLMESIHNESLREEQIVAAEKVIRLLYPTERHIKSFLQPDFTDFTPSIIAASTILYYVKH